MKSVLVFALIVGVALAGVFQIELTKVKSRRSKMIADGTWPAYQNYKELMRMSKGKNQVSQPVNDYDDLEYLGNVTLGTPPQQFSMILDTGSANLIVSGVKCDTCSKTSKRFDTTTSSTYKDQQMVCQNDFSGGTFRGNVGQDTFCIGGLGTSQLCIPSTSVCVASVERGILPYSHADGIFGMAFQSIAIDNVPPPLINAINQHLLDQPIFTVWLTGNGPVEGVPGGLFTYGALDTTNCGPVIAYQPLSSATYWQFRMTSISAGSYSSNTVADVMSDTGISLIGGPQSAVRGIADVANAVYDPDQGIYVIPCDAQPPDVILTIGANKYNINYKNYIIQFEGKCYLAFFDFASGGFGPTWILGDPFLRSYCNIYDIGRQRIGFATPKH